MHLSTLPQPPATDEWETRRCRIMGCAADAFVAHGFDGANLEDIAIAAGVGKATIYRLFADKADLFAAVILDAVREMAAPLRSTLRPDQPVDQALGRFAECYAERMTRPVAGTRPFYEMARVLVAASNSHPALARRCMAVFKRDMEEPLAAYFRAKVAGGTLRAEDGTFLAEHFTQLLFFTNRFAIEPESLPDPGELKALARRAVRLFLDGCRAPSA